MKLNFYLKRQKMSLEDFVATKNLKNYDHLCEYLKSINIELPNLDEVEYAFEVENVEKRTVDKSNSKKRGNTNKAGIKSQVTSSTSSRRSKTSQQTSKSSTKRQRKNNSNKIKSLQQSDRSEDSK